MFVLALSALTIPAVLGEILPAVDLPADPMTSLLDGTLSGAEDATGAEDAARRRIFHTCTDTKKMPCKHDCPPGWKFEFWSDDGCCSSFFSCGGRRRTCSYSYLCEDKAAPAPAPKMCRREKRMNCKQGCDSGWTHIGTVGHGCCKSWSSCGGNIKVCEKYEECRRRSEDEESGDNTESIAMIEEESSDNTEFIAMMEEMSGDETDAMSSVEQRDAHVVELAPPIEALSSTVVSQDLDKADVPAATS